jgi:thiol-disulfide isomerase/thioredoxin
MLSVVATLVIAGTCNALWAQKPTVEQALGLTPIQHDVNFERPTKDEVENCRISAEESGKAMAWVVRGPAGELLRRFVDTNGDNKVDQWCYYLNGVEIYRDIDDDFNGKADQYRWMGTAGIRWGLDKDEDGAIDRWSAISAEEVSSEIIYAVRDGDARRFENVLLTAPELKALQLGAELEAEIAKRIESARADFRNFAARQKVIQAKTEWVDFGGLRPGLVPSGTDASKQDIIVYENVVAMVETEGQHAQVPIGTLVETPQGWRCTGAPVMDGDAPRPAAQFLFFRPSQPTLADIPATDQGLSPQTEKLISTLESLDKQLAAARDPRELASLNTQRADTLEQLAAEAGDNDKSMWLMQLVDTVGGAAQSGAYPEGTRRLAKLLAELDRTKSDKELLAHTRFTFLSSQYAVDLQASDADFGKIQQQWLDDLASFVQDFPATRDTPEALLQLALANEFAGKEKDANRWYTTIVTSFPQSQLAAKAAGAKRRLESVGEEIAFAGKTIDGKEFDLSRLRGNVVLLHYWATWCEPCKDDMEAIRKLEAAYRKQKFVVVGVNLDQNQRDVNEFLRSQRLPWTQLYEPGGLDSRLANELGVFTLPVMILIDSRGRVVNRQLNVGELEAEVQKLLR